MGRWKRVRYVARCVGVAMVCYLVWDAVMVAERRTAAAGIPERLEWDLVTLGRVVYAELRMGLIVYCGMTMQFNLAAAVGVGLGLNGPEEWPALFGSLAECYTTANVWGKFWHQYIRQVSSLLDFPFPSHVPEVKGSTWCCRPLFHLFQATKPLLLIQESALPRHQSSSRASSRDSSPLARCVFRAPDQRVCD